MMRLQAVAVSLCCAMACGPSVEVEALSTGKVDSRGLLATRDRAFYSLVLNDGSVSLETVAWSSGAPTVLSEGNAYWWSAWNSTGYFAAFNGGQERSYQWAPSTGVRAFPAEWFPIWDEEGGPVVYLTTEGPLEVVAETAAPPTPGEQLIRSTCPVAARSSLSRVVVRFCDADGVHGVAWEPGRFAERVVLPMQNATQLAVGLESEAAFVLEEDGDLWAFSVLDGSARLLASDVSDFVYPDDGTAVIAWNAASITRVEVATLEAVRVVENEPVLRVVSSGALDVVAFVSSEGAQGERNWKLARAASPGESRALVESAPRGWSPVFSEDASRVAFKGEVAAGGDAPLIVEEVATGEKTVLAEGGVQWFRGGRGSDVYYAVNVTGTYEPVTTDDVFLEVLADLYVEQDGAKHRVASRLDVGAFALRGVPRSRSVVFVATDKSDRAPGLYLVP